MKKTYASLLLTLFSFCIGQQLKAQGCTAGFTSSSVADTAYFTDASSGGFGTIVAWAWNFGDGGFDNVQNPTHVYSACGIYNVSLTIFTSAFCSNTFSTAVTVTGGVTPTFTYTVDTTTGDVNFQAQPFGFNLEYAWDFGDGTVDSTIAPTHNYPAGTYYVCLTVADTGGLCSGTICDSIMVTIVPPSCTTTFTSNDNGGGNVGFQVSPFDFNMTYNWDYGDGTTGTGGFTFHNFTTAGTYYVCLTAVDSSTMCTSYSCDTIILSADSTACSGLTFNYFDNNGQVGFTSSPLSFSNSYTWDFGDGNTGTGTATSNTYAASGVYYACVTMYDPFNSCTAVFCDSVTVVITGVQENTLHNMMLNAYPNPVNERLIIDYNLTEASQVTIELMDLIGNSIYSENSSQIKGKHTIKISTDLISKGAYMIRISSSEGSGSKLIIKD
ncbi:MAG: PKD domain-containing protein [Bacteroidota bacterium]|nr:PKD domain-containing protein [Bacteroidota bacterium]